MAINHSHIIAFVLFPMERKALFGEGVIRSQRIRLETIHEIRNQVQKIYPNIGIFALDDNDDMINLLNIIINYFSGVE